MRCAPRSARARRDRRDAPPPPGLRRVPRTLDAGRDAAQPVPDGRHDPRARPAHPPQRALARWRYPPAPASSCGAARDPRDRSHRGTSPRSRRRTWIRARAGGRDPGGAGSRYRHARQHDRRPSPPRRRPRGRGRTSGARPGASTKARSHNRSAHASAGSIRAALAREWDGPPAGGCRGRSNRPLSKRCAATTPRESINGRGQAPLPDPAPPVNRRRVASGPQESSSG